MQPVSEAGGVKEKGVSSIVVIAIVIIIAAAVGSAYVVTRGDAVEEDLDLLISGINLPTDLFDVTDRQAFYQGLPDEAVPSEVAGKQVTGSVFRYTTPCGIRIIGAQYDGIFIYVEKAPKEEEAHLVFSPSDFGEYKAEISLNQIMTDTTPMGPGTWYGLDFVTAKAEDSIGLLWFTTRGETKSGWIAQNPFTKWEAQWPGGERYSFWWRSGVWIFGVDAENDDILNQAAKDLIQHLKSL